MKKLLSILLGMGIASWAVNSWADPRVDFYPTGLKFQSFHPDEFSERLAQRALVYVANGGNVMGGVRTLLGVNIKGANYGAYFYGPSGSLGEATHPGETAHLSAQLPQGTLRHCERVQVTIDTSNRLQFGPGTRGNDTRELIAYEIGKSPILCHRIIFPPKPRLPDPRL